MARRDKLLERVLSGATDATVDFQQLCRLLRGLGFDERSRGSHHIFTRSGITERINLQQDGRHAKPYQVEQVRGVLIKYQLGGSSRE